MQAEAVKAAAKELAELAEDMQQQNAMLDKVVLECEAPRNKDSATPMQDIMDNAEQLTRNLGYYPAWTLVCQCAVNGIMYVKCERTMAVDMKCVSLFWFDVYNSQQLYPLWSHR